MRGSSWLPLLCVAAALSAGCHEQIDPVGDWFFCKAVECTGLDSQGLRFSDDGHINVLTAPGNQYEPGREQYCEDIRYGTYTLEDDVLNVTEVTEAEMTRSFQFSQNGEVMSLRQGDDALSTLLKLVEEDSSGPCVP